MGTFLFFTMLRVSRRTIKFQWSVLQTGQDSSIYKLAIILGRVNDIISHFMCIFYTFYTSLELMQIFANGKRHFYSFTEFYLIDLKKKSRSKNLIMVLL